MDLLVPSAAATHPPCSQRAAATTSSVIRDLLSIVDSDRVLSLAGGLPAEDALPSAEIRRAADRVLVGSPGALQYGPTEGDPGLRAWIAAHELDRAAPDDVLVTHGSQQGLRLLVEALVDPGDVVVVERTSYVGMLQALAPAGATVVDIGGDGDGLDVEQLRRRLEAGLRPTLCYLAPTFQNPTGTVLSLPRRRLLGELAARHGFVVVDDDPYRELGDGPAPARLRSFVPPHLAVTLGSFSKTLAPGLRVGWVHGPSWLVEPLTRLKQSSDLHTSTLSQRVVASLVQDEDWFASHLRTVRTRNLHRAEVLVDELDRQLGAQVRVMLPRGGMFVWATFPALATDSDELLAAALRTGVAFVPGSAFDHLGRASRSARLCFATLPDDALREAVARLAHALDASPRR